MAGSAFQRRGNAPILARTSDHAGKMNEWQRAVLKIGTTAGLPWFVALFGRDTLIVSLQTMIVYPEFGPGRVGGAGGVSGDGAR
jgi:glycogen debranching enzyme